MLNLLLWLRSAALIALSWYTCALAAWGIETAADPLICSPGVPCPGGDWLRLGTLVCTAAVTTMGALVAAARLAGARSDLQLSLWLTVDAICALLMGSVFWGRVGWVPLGWVPVSVAVPVGVGTLVALREDRRTRLTGCKPHQAA